MTNFMKTTAFAAALTLAGTTAYAANEFAYQVTEMDGSTIEIEGVTSDADGFVVIYDYRGGEFGDVLGQETINEGANNDVRVVLGERPLGDVAAVLHLGEVTDPTQATAWIEIEVDDK